MNILWITTRLADARAFFYPSERALRAVSFYFYLRQHVSSSHFAMRSMSVNSHMFE